MAVVLKPRVGWCICRVLVSRMLLSEELDDFLTTACYPCITTLNPTAGARL